jgi:hypothetical protein
MKRMYNFLKISSKFLISLQNVHQKMPALLVVDERGHRSEGGAALGAEEGAFARVHDHVDLTLLRASERLGADVALERPVA